MDKRALARLKEGEKLICSIVEKEGLYTTDIDFEVVPPQKMLEMRAYEFPKNFSHWSFGRDYDKHATEYEHSQRGIPYEQVFNFRTPQAYIVDTAPFALQLMTMAHVFYHVDFFRSNRFTKHGHDLSDVAREARHAADRFRKYEEQYGRDKVEQLIDAAFAIRWHQNLDPFYVEQKEEVARERLMREVRDELRTLEGDDVRGNVAVTGKMERKMRIQLLKDKLRTLENRTPPEPTYDLLNYVMEHSPILKPWMRDVLGVVRTQTRALFPNGLTKMLNEGWATYGHIRLVRRLHQEGFLDAKEYAICKKFHARVTQKARLDFNWYSIGWKLYEYVEDAWNKGRFGKEYEQCRDAHQRATWDTNVMRGRETILQVRAQYNDRMAIERLFSDDFIHSEEIYIYQAIPSSDGSEVHYVMVNNDPNTIRMMLTRALFFYGAPNIRVENGDFRHKRMASGLYLKHCPFGAQEELDETYARATLQHIYYLWGRPIYLETRVGGKEAIYHCEGGKVALIK